MKYFFISLVLALSLFISFDANEHPSKLIWSDMEGYYIYLPATIIYGGFDSVKVVDKEYLRPFSDSNPKIYTKYTCGVAILEAPFFLIAHVLSRPLGFESDGHSLIYSYSIMLSGLFYFWLGIFYIFKFLGRRFNNTVIVWSLASVALGTNLYYYTFFQPAMSHVYSFGLASLLVYHSDTLLNEKNLRFSKVPLIAAVIGLMILIRPTNIVYFCYLFILALSKNKIRQLFSREGLKWIIFSVSIILLMWVPQISYWYYISGDYIIWSYVNESFIYLMEPKIFKVLFGAWNGWLLYSPMAIIPILNLIYGSFKKNIEFLAVLATLVISTYLFASWWAWWFGGAFGHRCYVDFLPLLALPLADLINKVKNRIIFVVLILLMYYNIGLTYQYVVSSPWDGPNWGYIEVWAVIKNLF